MRSVFGGGAHLPAPHLDRRRCNRYISAQWQISWEKARALGGVADWETKYQDPLAPAPLLLKAVAMIFQGRGPGRPNPVLKTGCADAAPAKASLPPPGYGLFGAAFGQNLSFQRAIFPK